MTDVRKWVERKATIAIGESGTSSDVKLIADTYTPTISKLAEALRGISEATVMESYDTGRVISAGHKEDAKAALDELEKP